MNKKGNLIYLSITGVIFFIAGIMTDDDTVSRAACMVCGAIFLSAAEIVKSINYKA